MKIDPTWTAKDFYTTLGVAKDATGEAIKTAYRKLARQFHPDTNQNDAEAAERFKEISEAYDVLGSEEKRKAYDNVRLFGAPSSRFGFSDLNLDDLSFDLFEDLSTNTTFRRRTGFTPPVRGKDVDGALTITFDQACAGGELVLTGTHQDVTITVPVGVMTGDKVKFPGQGLPNASGVNPGDLYITFTVEPHAWFTNDGSRLFLDLPVTFDELALGDTVDVPLYPEGSVKLKIPAGTPNGRKFKIAGKGLTLPSGTVGDLVVTVKVEVPKSLPTEAVAAVELYRKATEIHTPRTKFAVN